ncbi:hypothetical protein [Aquamicrobium terrae]|uniref:KTSC domain-containing protein n=1 Tax=Aquamicrobium terrae TaxID=1324945 RepID=A0ABV2MV57_9HYPH
MSALGYAEGEMCNRGGCVGVIELHRSENCSCHITPPCLSCTSPRGYCPACDWQEADDPLVVMEVTTIHLPTGFIERRKRVLDPSKIDYRIEAHSNSSQKVIGVYPEGTARAEVEQRVKGTFGGRFERFGSGHFTYIASTD